MEEQQVSSDTETYQTSRCHRLEARSLCIHQHPSLGSVSVTNVYYASFKIPGREQESGERTTIWCSLSLDFALYSKVLSEVRFMWKKVTPYSQILHHRLDPL
jgi:hypothetical protein